LGIPFLLSSLEHDPVFRNLLKQIKGFLRRADNSTSGGLFSRGSPE
jgi:hypothetical protein